MPRGSKAKLVRAAPDIDQKEVKDEELRGVGTSVGEGEESWCPSAEEEEDEEEEGREMEGHRGQEADEKLVRDRDGESKQLINDIAGEDGQGDKKGEAE